MTDDPRTADEIAGSVPTYVEWRERAETAERERDIAVECAETWEQANIQMARDNIRLRAENRKLRDAIASALEENGVLRTRAVLRAALVATEEPE